MADVTTEANTGILIPNVGSDFGSLFQSRIATALSRLGSLVNKLITAAVGETRVMFFMPLTTTACTIGAATGDVALGAVDGSSVAVFQIQPPHGVTLTGVNLFVTPGVHSVLPTTPISMSLSYVDFTDGTSHVLFASTPDPSATIAVYDVFHSFTGRCSHVVDRTKYKYVLTVVGENDAVNGVTGGLVRGITGVWTRAAGSTLGQD